MNILSLLLLVICLAGVSLAQESKEQKKKAKYDAVVALVESGKFEFFDQKANPQGGRQIDLSTKPNFFHE